MHAADWKWSAGHDELHAWHTVSECPEQANAMYCDELHVVQALQTVLAFAVHAVAVYVAGGHTEHELHKYELRPHEALMYSFAVHRRHKWLPDVRVYWRPGTESGADIRVRPLAANEPYAMASVNSKFSRPRLAS